MAILTLDRVKELAGNGSFDLRLNCCRTVCDWDRYYSAGNWNTFVQDSSLDITFQPEDNCIYIGDQDGSFGYDITNPEMIMCLNTLFKNDLGWLIQMGIDSYDKLLGSDKND